MENDLLVWTLSTGRTSQESVLRDTSDREKVQSIQKQESFPAKLKLFHRQNQFHRQNPFNRFDNALLRPANSNFANLCLAFFIEGCFPERLIIPFVFPLSRIS